MTVIDVLDKQPIQRYFTVTSIGLILTILTIFLGAIGIWMLFRSLIGSAIEGALAIDEAPRFSTESHLKGLTR